MLHLIVGTRFIEPTGSFDGSGLLWDRALLWVAAGHAGVCGARLIDLACRRREFSESAIVPSWYPARRAAVWVATAVFMVATIAWNGFDGGFYQIGPAGRNLLPLKLHVAFSFWLMGGGAVWTAALVAWERQLRGSLGPLALLVPAAEGLATSFTTLSRATYVIRVAPYALMTALRPDVVRRTPVRRFVVVVGALVVGLALSLAVVSMARALIYPTSVPLTADVRQTNPTLRIRSSRARRRRAGPSWSSRGRSRPLSSALDRPRGGPRLRFGPRDRMDTLREADDGGPGSPDGRQLPAPGRIAVSAG